MFEIHKKILKLVNPSGMLLNRNVNLLKSGMSSRKTDKKRKNTKKIKKKIKIGKNKMNKSGILGYKNKKQKKMIKKKKNVKKNYKKLQKQIKKSKKFHKKVKKKDKKVKIQKNNTKSKNTQTSMSRFWWVIGWTLVMQSMLPIGWKLNFKYERNDSTEEDFYQKNIWLVKEAQVGESMSGIGWTGVLTLPEGWKMSCMTQRSKPRIPAYYSSKDFNKRVRARNGNQTNQLRIAHWNIGAKLWNNKIEQIEMVLEDLKPDLLYISEANLWKDLPDGDRVIPGHKLFYPKTMSSMEHARLVLIAKDSIEVNILQDYMDDEIPSIWCKIGSKKKGITVGGFYREYTQLGTEHEQDNPQIRQQKQEARWDKWMTQWKLASRVANCYVIGDLNLDYLKWGNPDSPQEAMIEAVKADIETAGFTQMISSYTRSMANTADSCLDHIWSNSSHRILRHWNLVKGESDHNLVGLDIALGNIRIGGQNTRQRKWSLFDVDRFKKAVKETVWDDILDFVDVELANTALEDRLREILDNQIPMKTVQSRAKYNSWITESTKITMAQRDESRRLARSSGDPAEWNKFRKLRNKCTDLQKKDKQLSLKKIYDGIESERDPAKLFATTKFLLGWNRASTPTSFRVAGRTLNKQSDVANVQAKFYADKIEKIKNSIPRVNWDPHWYLRRALERWKPQFLKPHFSLKVTDLKEVMAIIKENES